MLSERWAPTRWQLNWAAYELTVLLSKPGKYGWQLQLGPSLIRIGEESSLAEAEAMALKEAKADVASRQDKRS